MNVLSKRLMLAAVAVGMGNCCAWGYQAATDSGTAQSSFEVASVRADHSGSQFCFNTQQTATRFVMKCWCVLDMVQYAYDVREAQVIGGPKWISSERFDVDAKIADVEAEKEGDLSPQQSAALMRSRVRDLLAKRFGLKVHQAEEQMSVLALVVADKQPKFAEAKASQSGGTGGEAPQVNMRMYGHELVLKLENAPLKFLVGPLSGQPETGGHLVVDETGLTKNYDLTLRWQMQNLAGTNSADAEDAGTTLFTALREQLGLKLEARKAPVETVTIDQVERPTDN